VNYMRTQDFKGSAYVPLRVAPNTRFVDAVKMMSEDHMYKPGCQRSTAQCDPCSVWCWCWCWCWSEQNKISITYAEAVPKLLPEMVTRLFPVVGPLVGKILLKKKQTGCKSDFKLNSCRKFVAYREIRGTVTE
jgi:hypothetical protein